jgi:molybdopterin-guanine dinucleotide biosynthesis protein A
LSLKDPLMWTAAILAGGRARRLGGLDKSVLPVGERSVLDRQLGMLRALTPHILIVGHDDPRYREAGVPVVVDRIAGAGSLGGLYTALMAAPTQQIIVMACDMPFLTAPFLVHLAARGAGVDAAIPRDERGWHPLSAAWARSAAPQLRARIDAGSLRIVDAIAELDVREIGPAELAPFDPDSRLLVNINTPDDYARALEAAEPPPRIV